MAAGETPEYTRPDNGMTESDKTEAPRLTARGARRAEDRMARRAAALRENLRRRKERNRARDGESTGLAAPRGTPENSD